MTTLKENKTNSKKSNLRTINKEDKSNKGTDAKSVNKTNKTTIKKSKISKTTVSKNKPHNKTTIKNINSKTPKKTTKKHTQTGGSDVCSRDLNDLLTGNPLVMTGKETDFEGDLNKIGKEFADDVMGSFKGVGDGWAGNPGMPPKLPSGCTIL